MYKEPWCNINDFPVEHRKYLLNELTNELNPSHILYGATAKILAKREDRDDILLEHNNEYYIVHLTWSGKPELGEFPVTKHFPNLDALNHQLAEDTEFFR